jgi:hypothetical protein
MSALALSVEGSVPPATAQSGRVDIVSASNYTSSTGSLWLVGEVVNNTSSTVEYVKVIVSYYDGAGALVATDSTYSDMDELLPGETSPFSSLTLDPPAGIVRHDLAVEYRTTGTTPLRGFDVRVGNVRRSSTGSLRFTGEVINNTGKTAEFVKIMVALYDGAGTVIRVDDTYSERDTIAAGGRSPFEILILDAPMYDSYKLWVDGRAVR